MYLFLSSYYSSNYLFPGFITGVSPPCHAHPLMIYVNRTTARAIGGDSYTVVTLLLHPRSCTSSHGVTHNPNTYCLNSLPQPHLPPSSSHHSTITPLPTHTHILNNDKYQGNHSNEENNRTRDGEENGGEKGDGGEQEDNSDDIHKPAQIPVICSHCSQKILHLSPNTCNNDVQQIEDVIKYNKFCTTNLLSRPSPTMYADCDIVVMPVPHMQLPPCFLAPQAI